MRDVRNLVSLVTRFGIDPELLPQSNVHGTNCRTTEAMDISLLESYLKCYIMVRSVALYVNLNEQSERRPKIL